MPRRIVLLMRHQSGAVAPYNGPGLWLSYIVTLFYFVKPRRVGKCVSVSNTHFRARIGMPWVKAAYPATAGPCGVAGNVPVRVLGIGAVHVVGAWASLVTSEQGRASVPAPSPR